MNLVKQLGLQVEEKFPVKVRGTGEYEVPYVGLTTAILRLPSIKSFEREEPFLVLPANYDPHTIHIQLGTSVIDLGLLMMSESELNKSEAAWNRCRFASMVSACLLYTSDAADD